jgi:hypothetical protein
MKTSIELTYVESEVPISTNPRQEQLDPSVGLDAVLVGFALCKEILCIPI